MGFYLFWLMETDEMVETYAEFNEQQLKKYSEDIASYLTHGK